MQPTKNIFMSRARAGTAEVDVLNGIGSGEVQEARVATTADFAPVAGTFRGRKLNAALIFAWIFSIAIYVFGFGAMFIWFSYMFQGGAEAAETSPAVADRLFWAQFCGVSCAVSFILTLIMWNFTVPIVMPKYAKETTGKILDEVEPEKEEEAPELEPAERGVVNIDAEAEARIEKDSKLLEEARRERAKERKAKEEEKKRRKRSLARRAAEAVEAEAKKAEQAIQDLPIVSTIKERHEIKSIRDTGMIGDVNLNISEKGKEFLAKMKSGKASRKDVLEEVRKFLEQNGVNPDSKSFDYSVTRGMDNLDANTLIDLWRLHNDFKFYKENFRERANMGEFLIFYNELGENPNPRAKKNRRVTGRKFITYMRNEDRIKKFTEEEIEKLRQTYNWSEAAIEDAARQFKKYGNYRKDREKVIDADAVDLEKEFGDEEFKGPEP
jgi:hypothetical protein